MAWLYDRWHYVHGVIHISTLTMASGPVFSLDVSGRRKKALEPSNETQEDWRSHCTQRVARDSSSQFTVIDVMRWTMRSTQEPANHDSQGHSPLCRKWNPRVWLGLLLAPFEIQLRSWLCVLMCKGFEGWEVDVIWLLILRPLLWGQPLCFPLKDLLLFEGNAELCHSALTGAEVLVTPRSGSPTAGARSLELFLDLPVACCTQGDVACRSFNAAVSAYLAMEWITLCRLQIQSLQVFNIYSPISFKAVAPQFSPKCRNQFRLAHCACWPRTSKSLPRGHREASQLKGRTMPSTFLSFVL